MGVASRHEYFDADPSEVSERVRYSDTVLKINRKGKKQKRAFVITNLAVYNFAPKAYKSFKRRINIAHIGKVMLLQGGFEACFHMWEYALEHDTHVSGGGALHTHTHVL